MQNADRIRILIALNLNPPWDGFPEDVEPIFCGPSTSEIDACMNPKVEVLMTDALPTALASCRGLRWIQLVSANTSQLMRHPLLSRNILLSNASGVTAAHAAEHILGCVLDHIKCRPEFKQLQQKHAWPNRLSMACRTLRNIEVAIVGYGAIGRETARLLHAFGARIVAVTRTGKRTRFRGYLPHQGMGDPEAALPAEMVPVSHAATAVRRADFLVLAVPLNSSTEELVDEHLLALMQNDAVIINISRGLVVSSSALLQALNNGRLAHAYLDVFDKEPLPPDSPFWDHSKITVTPHMAGVMDDHGKGYRDLLLTNLIRYRKKQPLLNELDRTAFIEERIEPLIQSNA